MSPQRLERELKRDYHIITAEKRLDQIARDFVAALLHGLGDRQGDAGLHRQGHLRADARADPANTGHERIARLEQELTTAAGRTGGGLPPAPDRVDARNA